jgi:hypothetical protein
MAQAIKDARDSLATFQQDAGEQPGNVPKRGQQGKSQSTGQRQRPSLKQQATDPLEILQ